MSNSGIPSHSMTQPRYLAVPSARRRFSPALRRFGGAHWLAMSPSLGLLLVFIYGFIGWTVYISVSASKMVPDMTFVGLRNYEKLWRIDPWIVATHNAVIFTVLYVGVGIGVGLGLAILLDQRIRGEGFFRTVFLYPAALSLVVTGIVWKWLLNPGTGIESFVRSLGFDSFSFGWIIDAHFVIYTLVIAGVWQVAGFAMALFLAALRSVDDEILRAARLDGASAWGAYLHIVIPSIKSTFVTVSVLLAAFALKTFDLVVAMTAGGPGYSSSMPANFMFDMAFWRNQLGVSAASAITLLAFSLVLVSPYVFFRVGGVGRQS
jgi:glucose/mannose transport system permease protein